MGSGLTELHQLAFRKLKEKHPAFPEHAIPVPKFSDKKANDLTKCIFHWLSLNEHYVTRINTQGQYNQGLKRFTKSTTRLGTADVHAIVNGQHLSVEVKIGKDIMSDHQVRTKQDVEKAGGLYFIAKDFQTFYDYYLDITKKSGNHGK